MAHLALVLNSPLDSPRSEPVVIEEQSKGCDVCGIVIKVAVVALAVIASLVLCLMFSFSWPFLLVSVGLIGGAILFASLWKGCCSSSSIAISSRASYPPAIVSNPYPMYSRAFHRPLPMPPHMMMRPASRSMPHPPPTYPHASSNVQWREKRMGPGLRPPGPGAFPRASSQVPSLGGGRGMHRPGHS